MSVAKFFRQETASRQLVAAYAESVYRMLKEAGLHHRDAISVVSQVVGKITDELSQIDEESDSHD